MPDGKDGVPGERMIPIQDRIFRPCEMCHCYWEATCAHDGVGCSINGPRTEYSGYEWDRNNTFKRDSDKIACVYNLTKEEYAEMMVL